MSVIVAVSEGVAPILTVRVAAGVTVASSGNDVIEGEAEAEEDTDAVIVVTVVLVLEGTPFVPVLDRVGERVRVAVKEGSWAGGGPIGRRVGAKAIPTYLLNPGDVCSSVHCSRTVAG